MPVCLVVDDDPMACKIAADVAGSLGLQVQIEANGMAATLFCKAVIPDIIILDIEMPKMDGIGFLKELHKMIGGRHAHVIACTAKSDLETVRTLKEEGVKGYIVKPFDPEALADKIRESGVL